jgi:hypothetical protein
MKRWREILICAGTGFAFWLPSIVLHATRGYHFGAARFDMISVLILPIITSAIALELLVRSGCVSFRRGAITLWLLLGIWMLGPLSTTISSSFSGGGFTQPAGWVLVVAGIVLFAPITFMTSTYDGTLGPLAVVTLWFCIAGLIGLSKRSSEPPPAGAAGGRSP